MLLVVAWDGACFDIVDPLAASGRLPAISRMMDEGARREVESTVPAVTFPAWTTFATAASPARHGVTDFSVRDGYGMRFLNATHRRLPALWNLVSERGGTAGVYALPVTYPPDEIRGFMVCGFDTPLGAARLGARSHPASVAREIEQRYGGLAVGGPPQARIDAGWHERALRHMLDAIDLRTRIAADLLRERRFDCFIVHYGESDTVAHQFWHLCDASSPRFVAGGPADAIERVYAALDAGLARLRDAAGAGASVMVVSDHGSGGSAERAIFWNRWLAERGYLTFARRRLRARLSRGARHAALRIVPQSWQASAFAALARTAARVEAATRLGGIDWRRTRAFSEELNYFPAIWLNLRGREPLGTVDASAAGEVLEALARDLADFRDPLSAEPVVARVLRREEVADGPFAERLPDLILELHEPGGYSYAAMGSRAGAERHAMRALAGAELSGARGASMPGAHRRRGMCVLAGARVRRGRFGPGTLADAGATAMALCGCAPHAAADGKAWSDCIEPRSELARPAASASGRGTRPIEYGRDEAEQIADRLRALGYLA